MPMHKYHARVQETAVNIPKPKNNTIGIIAGYVIVAVILICLYQKPAEPEVVVVVKEEPEEIVVLNPVPSSITLSEPLWLNAPEDIMAEQMEDMQVRFRIKNHNTYPVTGITVEFTFYDLEDVDLGEARVITFDDVLQANEEKSYPEYTVGSYPRDTITVKSEVLSVSAHQ